jgi:hypothetical protein
MCNVPFLIVLQMENWQESGGTRQGSLETSSQQLMFKMNSNDSYSMQTAGALARSSLEESGGQDLDNQFHNGSFASHQVRPPLLCHKCGHCRWQSFELGGFSDLLLCNEAGK